MKSIDDAQTQDNRLQVRFPDPLRGRLQRFAEKAGMTMSAVVKASVNDYLAQRGY